MRGRWAKRFPDAQQRNTRCETAASHPLSRGKQVMIWSGSNVFRGGGPFSSPEMNSEGLLV